MHYECKCKQVFCLGCRMPEDHSCEFDFQQLGKTDIAKSNPLISGEKMNKI